MVGQLPSRQEKTEAGTRLQGLTWASTLTPGLPNKSPCGPLLEVQEEVLTGPMLARWPGSLLKPHGTKHPTVGEQ